MPLMQAKGGIPKIVKGDATTTAMEWAWQGGRSNYLYFKVTGANDITLYFNADDAANDKGLVLSTGNVVELPAELSSIWVKTAAATSAFTAIVLLHRG